MIYARTIQEYQAGRIDQQDPFLGRVDPQMEAMVGELSLSIEFIDARFQALAMELCPPLSQAAHLPPPAQAQAQAQAHAQWNEGPVPPVDLWANGTTGTGFEIGATSLVSPRMSFTRLLLVFFNLLT